MGVSRWPADVPHPQRTLSPAALARPTSIRNLRNAISRMLRGRPSHESRLREMLHNGMPNDEPSGTRQPLISQPGRRVWRPPVSGQTGRTIGNPQQPDPFRNTQKTHPTTCNGAYNQRPPIPERRLMAPLPQAPCRDVTPVRSPQGVTTSTGDSNATMSPSQRALSCASGYAVPVSPHRVASKRALRYAAVPSHLRPPSEHGQSPAPSSSVPDMGTMRTDDLLQSFPPPPSQIDRPNLRPSRSVPGKRPSWSLFPRANGDREQAIALQPLPPRTTPSANTCEHSHDDDALTQSVIRSFLEETHGRFFTARTTLGNVHSGLLQADDRREEQQCTASANRLPPPATRALRAPDQTDRDSARETVQPQFVTQPRADTAGQSCLAARAENAAVLTATPTTIVQGPQLCKHKLAKIQAARRPSPMLHVAGSATFDGSNASPIMASDPIAQDHAVFGPRTRTSLASNNLAVLPPAPVGSAVANAEPQANAIGASSPSPPQMVAIAPQGTTFTIHPDDPHYRGAARAATFNTVLSGGPSEHDRA